jgi:MPBQ/MSBQ methyltransferase
VRAARSAPTLADVERHLRDTCGGVFPPDAIGRHVSEHVGVDTSRELVAHVLSRAGGAETALDIGCGYGSFVLAAREAGLDAIGVEPADFELRFARGRIGRARPQDEAERVYVRATGVDLPFPDERFDVVTLWNVVEHVHDTERLLAESVRVLRPGGRLFLLAPNYCAFRREAHYLVPWLPLLPRPIARTYLRAMGRDPRFLDDHIVYCTVVGVRRILRRLPISVVDPRSDKLSRPQTIRQPRVRAAVSLLERLHLARLLGSMLGASAGNPFRRAIQLEAVKDHHLR